MFRLGTALFAELAVSPGLMPRPSLSGHLVLAILRKILVSPGLMPRPSLSEVDATLTSAVLAECRRG